MTATDIIMRETPRPSKCPQEVSYQKWTKRIAAVWQKGVEAILETGRLLIEAKAALDHGQFKAMVQLKLPFTPRTAQRLMEIARNPVISNATHASLLPPSWMTLHELTKVPDEILVAKIKDGVITPKLERKDVALLLGRGTTKRPTCGAQATKAKAAVPPAMSAETVREVIAPDEELALLREFARFVINVAKSVSTDPKDHGEWKLLRGRVTDIFGGAQ
jgi:hypothetical protein